MEFEVPDQILKETTKCQNEFACLKRSNPENLDGHKICEVDYADGKNVLFLKTKGTTICPYRISFAFSQVCTCPTHFNIHKQYESGLKSNGE